jgi:hypothetical protein
MVMEPKGLGQQTWNYCHDDQSHKSMQGNNYAFLEMSTKMLAIAMMGNHKNTQR